MTAGRPPDPEAMTWQEEAEYHDLSARLADAGWLCGEIIYPDGVVLECTGGILAVLGKGPNGLERARDAARRIGDVADPGSAPV